MFTCLCLFSLCLEPYVLLPKGRGSSPVEVDRQKFWLFDVNYKTWAKSPLGKRTIRKAKRKQKGKHPPTRDQPTQRDSTTLLGQSFEVTDGEEPADLVHGNVLFSNTELTVPTFLYFYNPSINYMCVLNQEGARHE